MTLKYLKIYFLQPLTARRFQTLTVRQTPLITGSTIHLGNFTRCRKTRVCVEVVHVCGS